MRLLRRALLGLLSLGIVFAPEGFVLPLLGHEKGLSASVIGTLLVAIMMPLLSISRSI